mmetsp:Transcript_39073/g.94475  ORF Transcript_39073/g.94475 Transcript_39073/m.94475 type:complete len:224 (+) Transcript_39073:84-755(+)
MSSSSPAPDLLSDDDDAIDETLIAMNAEFEKMLNAEIDEVAEISSRKSPRSLSPSSFVYPDDKDQSFGLDSTRSKEGGVKFQFDTKTAVSAKPATVDDSDNDDDDDSFLEEMSALKDVAKQIEEALRDENTDSMDVAVQKIKDSPQNTKAVLLQSADKRIINKILGEEKHKKTMPENRIEQIMYIIRNDGLNAKETTNVLSVLCVLVWSIAFSLMRSVMHAEL